MLVATMFVSCWNSNGGDNGGDTYDASHNIRISGAAGLFAIHTHRTVALCNPSSIRQREKILHKNMCDSIYAFPRWSDNELLRYLPVLNTLSWNVSGVGRCGEYD